jgi:putative ABC transport system permease protein
VIIDRELARRHFVDEDPLGRKIRTSYATERTRTIVGIVGRVRQTALDLDPAPHIYIPYAQEPATPGMAIVLNSRLPASSLAAAARTVVRGLDRHQPISEIRSMNEIVSGSIAPRRFIALVLAVFALTALLLSLVGVYGLIAFRAGSRTHEIGLRIALGAPRAGIVRWMLKETAVLLSAGLVLGLAGSALLGEYLKSFLFAVDPFDFVTLAGVSLLLCGSGLAAAFAPTWRAARIDPTLALRST